MRYPLLPFLSATLLLFAASSQPLLAEPSKIDGLDSRQLAAVVAKKWNDLHDLVRAYDQKLRAIEGADARTQRKFFKAAQARWESWVKDESEFRALLTSTPGGSAQFFYLKRAEYALLSERIAFLRERVNEKELIAE